MKATLSVLHAIVNGQDSKPPKLQLVFSNHQPAKTNEHDTRHSRHTRRVIRPRDQPPPTIKMLLAKMRFALAIVVWLMATTATTATAALVFHDSRAVQPELEARAAVDTPRPRDADFTEKEASQLHARTADSERPEPVTPMSKTRFRRGIGPGGRSGRARIHPAILRRSDSLAKATSQLQVRAVGSEQSGTSSSMPKLRPRRPMMSLDFVRKKVGRPLKHAPPPPSNSNVVHFEVGKLPQGFKYMKDEKGQPQMHDMSVPVPDKWKEWTGPPPFQPPPPSPKPVPVQSPPGSPKPRARWDKPIQYDHGDPITMQVGGPTPKGTAWAVDTRTGERRVLNTNKPILNGFRWDDDKLTPGSTSPTTDPKKTRWNPFSRGPKSEGQTT